MKGSTPDEVLGVSHALLCSDPTWLDLVEVMKLGVRALRFHAKMDYSASELSSGHEATINHICRYRIAMER